MMSKKRGSPDGGGFLCVRDGWLTHDACLQYLGQLMSHLDITSSWCKYADNEPLFPVFDPYSD